MTREPMTRGKQRRAPWTLAAAAGVWNPANETYYMYYCAVGNQGRGIGLITSKPIDD